ncbi:BLUF domain-containing protein [Psychrobacter proteolyticus]|uniref:BLUF domain-containing protein n=1 Tax=Psychrobacter proteolyticus TaxID=147825 RepID=UPI000E0B7F0C|nr:BLUF domain-containing protein [Psychrobacter proteolyticus]
MISDERNNDCAHILTSLTYIGKNREKDNGVKMARTFEIARRNNEQSGITSALAINDNYIIQNIEGLRLDVNELLTRIITERPHLSIHVVEIKEVEMRKWDGFLIRYLTSGPEYEVHTLKHFSTGTDFNPYLMTKDRIINFMDALFTDERLNEI